MLSDEQRQGLKKRLGLYDKSNEMKQRVKRVFMSEWKKEKL